MNAQPASTPARATPPQDNGSADSLPQPIRDRLVRQGLLPAVPTNKPTR